MLLFTNCREGFFPETKPPLNTILGNSIGTKRAEADIPRLSSFYRSF